MSVSVGVLVKGDMAIESEHGSWVWLAKGFWVVPERITRSISVVGRETSPLTWNQPISPTLTWIVSTSSPPSPSSTVTVTG